MLPYKIECDEVRQVIATTTRAMTAHRDSKELSAPYVATVDSRTLHGVY